MKKSAKLMTKGSIAKNILLFAYPIFLGNLFQQLYQTVDSLVIGNYGGKESLAAISSCGALIFLLVGLTNGIFMGAGVVISKYFGAGCKENVQKSIHTTIAFALVSSIFMTIVGYFAAPEILKMMGTPDSVIKEATIYVQIYFLGSTALIIYNSASGILQAMGDSKHPLYFLIVSSSLNIILDLIFVIKFNLGIAGVGYATVISQSVSALLSLRILLTTKEEFKIQIKLIKFDKNILIQILKMGIPSGIQNSVISIANIFVQASVNSFGAIAMAGNGAFMRIQGFVFLPIISFSLALTTFTSQNLGAHEFDRVKKGAKFGILFSILIAEIIGVFIFFYSDILVSFFNNDPHVVEIGVQKAYVEALFFFLLALSHCMAGLYRGAGKAVIPMLVMFLFWCIFRVSYITVALNIYRDIRVLFSAYPITWGLSSIFFVIYFFKVDWMKEKKHKKEELPLC